MKNKALFTFVIAAFISFLSGCDTQDLNDQDVPEAPSATITYTSNTFDYAVKVIPPELSPISRSGLKVDLPLVETGQGTFRVEASSNLNITSTQNSVADYTVRLLKNGSVVLSKSVMGDIGPGNTIIYDISSYTSISSSDQFSVQINPQYISDGCFNCGPSGYFIRRL